MKPTNKKEYDFFLAISIVSSPHSFHEDPDPAQNLNADPNRQSNADPDPGLYQSFRDKILNIQFYNLFKVQGETICLYLRKNTGKNQ
jgi:hypothetical protein